MPDELARLRAIEAAARAYLTAQRAIWQLRQHTPVGSHECVHWMSQRDELGDESDLAMNALATALGLDG